MLPEENADAWIDDLQELPIEVMDENSNGLFDGNDQILFYAKGPHSWSVSGNEFGHEYNLYTDRAFYFLNVGIDGHTQLVQQATVVTDQVRRRRLLLMTVNFLETDINKVVDSGKQWFGEKFEYTLSYNYGFNFPHIVTTEPVLLTCRAIRAFFRFRNADGIGSGRTTAIESLFRCGVQWAGCRFCQCAKGFCLFSASDLFYFPDGDLQQCDSTRQAWPGWIMYGCRQKKAARYGWTPADDISRSAICRNGSGHGFQFVELPSGCQSVWEVTDIHQVKGNTAHAEWNQCCLSGSNRRFAGVCRLLRLVLPDASVDRIGGQPGSAWRQCTRVADRLPQFAGGPCSTAGSNFTGIILVSLWKPFPWNTSTMSLLGGLPT